MNVHTLQVGHMSTDQLLMNLESRGVYVSTHANEMMRSGAFVGRRMEVRYTTLSLLDLGFNRVVPLHKVHRRANERHGLELCPPQVGPYLRLQFLDQMQGYENNLGIAMEGINTDGIPMAFGLSRNENNILTLDGIRGFSESGCDPREKFIFLVAKKVA